MTFVTFFFFFKYIRKEVRETDEGPRDDNTSFVQLRGGTRTSCEGLKANYLRLNGRSAVGFRKYISACAKVRVTAYIERGREEDRPRVVNSIPRAGSAY